MGRRFADLTDEQLAELSDEQRLSLAADPPVVKPYKHYSYFWSLTPEQRRRVLACTEDHDFWPDGGPTD